MPQETDGVIVLPTGIPDDSIIDPVMPLAIARFIMEQVAVFVSLFARPTTIELRNFLWDLYVIKSLKELIDKHDDYGLQNHDALQRDIDSHILSI